jgi:hypothetical protein
LWPKVFLLMTVQGGVRCGALAVDYLPRVERRIVHFMLQKIARTGCAALLAE